MPIRTTLIWVVGMLLGLGGLLLAAQSFLPQSSAVPETRPANAEADRSGPEGPPLMPRDLPDGTIARPDRDEPEAVSLENSPNLDSWYAESGTGGEPFDPAPEDNSYLINSAKPYDTDEDGRVLLIPE